MACSLLKKGQPFRTEIRKNVFTHRVVNLWNSLPQKAVEANSLDAFKRELNRALKDSGVKGNGRRQERGTDCG